VPRDDPIAPARRDYPGRVDTQEQDQSYDEYSHRCPLFAQRTISTQ